jgi:ABC-2 type transport system ATP-binding protein
MPRSRLTALVSVLSLVVALVGLSPASADDHVHTSYDESIESFDGTEIWATIYKPAGASAENPVPMILHSHGWGGTRTSSSGAFQAELSRGFGVLSFDQRGHGQTGGRATVQNPEIEGRDVIAVIDYVAGLDWVMKENEETDGGETAGLPGQAVDRAREAARGVLGGDNGGDDDGTAESDNPVLFAMGGSYGGGYQLVGALTELRESSRTRFTALAPEITWFDLADSLAPDKVTRSAWVSLLYAAGANMHEDDIHVAFAYGSATGQWPDGTVPGVPNLQERFWRNGPVAFVEEDGIQLDIPVLIGQGATDNLFNLNQGWKNFERTLTDEARERSVFIGYNGGHALPNALPPGHPFAVEVGTNADACSPGGFSALRLDFFEAVLAGADPRDLVGGSAYSLMTADGECVQTDSLDDYTEIETGLDVQVARLGATTTGVGAVQQIELASGPLTVAGVPLLDATVTSLGVDQRVFFALSVGASPATARVVQNNMMPLRELTPVAGESRTVELPGIAVDVPEGQSLYLTISPISDMSFGHGSVRTPGFVLLQDMIVHLPILE